MARFCFYPLQVGPLFATFAFGPSILKAFGIGEGNLSNLGSVIGRCNDSTKGAAGPVVRNAHAVETWVFRKINSAPAKALALIHRSAVGPD